MSNYYSPEICKQLEQLGCVASSGFWINKNGGEVVAYDKTQMSDWITHRDTVICRLFSTADFLASPAAKGNCIKLWGKKRICFNEHVYPQECSCILASGIEDSYLHYSHKLLDTILSGKDGESLIKKALETEETIEIGGKKYSKAKVESCLKGLREL